MTLAMFVEIALGVLKFPETILKFIKLIKGTPLEKHEALLAKLQEETTKFEDTGRPSWK
jgi:hypothetical protein